MSSNSKVTLDGFTLRIELARAEIRNAFNPQLIAELSEAFLLPFQNPNIRLVVLSGEGKSFCAGADLNWMKEMAQYTEAENQADALKLFEMFERIYDCPVPVVCRVQGAAFGGALGLLAASDYVVAAEGTQFCFSEVKLGIAPAVISAFVLRKSSLGFAGPFMMSGKVFSAEEALRIGLAHEVVSADNLAKASEAIENSFVSAGPEAVRATKSLLRKMQGLSWEQQRKETTDLISRLRVSPEGQEGLGAFLQKREAAWRVK